MICQKPAFYENKYDENVFKTSERIPDLFWLTEHNGSQI